ncbi:nck-associated protein 5 isoform X4 [Hemicordylus capensis]|uniref:nck-associated protein 5 isoform X4 n=1 Tax=Hemicordylus capensis TaxID=884348 RepID=UPI0023038390|nr:nck-associated protein 5 isoform X4 [Hemicordylus capensis]XP_053109149.1 nck-associated protein 5 isoform X4 [Hemicordylus capensis]XP_053109159.1 nck-associated protein 5 isoform X4 [Hemicordylus capensis]XP_053109168.1 nck-associated protein 5 isoform X4 [Hemicordylus capensis]XP_053109176.1 nck-associated protein 5 isoform X4 [Hemicordylus capensis]XP_053109181.1 nck-associated protein 5 isoform X4 [Hemicordylus capensis]XP_053109185.1 nck-associated protein 5 isoform X4 [Hemicordylus 
MERKQIVKKKFGKRFSLDSSLMDYVDSNKYIDHLLTPLEEQRWNAWREKLSVAGLQQEVERSKSDGTMQLWRRWRELPTRNQRGSRHNRRTQDQETAGTTMREKLIHELEEERHLRLESEKKLREVTLESERNRAQMRGLQQQFSRMEETVRNLLQNQGSPEPNGEEPVTEIKNYQETIMQEAKRCKTGVEDTCMAVDKDSRNENSSTEEEKETTKLLLERLKALEAENSALAMENENQREQYERCLDEVANQVVQALLTQKDLREECLKLKTRVFDLEQQNRTLSVLFQQRMKPTSGLLLQKLHSRILDLSSGDFLSEVEKNRSLIPSQSADVQVHECQLNMKSGIPALKCQSQLNMTGPNRVYPRSSCSSSELSLSSACSEYSSGSSYTWNDGKACSKRSSVNWDKRISIGSSLPSNLSSPADDLPPTRIKENHILEGLKKLQKQKLLLEPPSVISKWGYKDCMDSNEGIYSPGFKCSSHKEQEHCMPEEIGAICIEHQKTFMYDSDSHEDADDESSSLALLYEVPSKDCRHYCNKLTHSVSDSLFGREPDRKHSPERGSYFNSKERPEKLTSFINEFQSEAKSCTNVKIPVLQIEKSLANVGWRDLNLHLSDTDDNEILDELHIESSDEKSPSDLSLTPFVDKHTMNCDMLVKMKNSRFVVSEKEANQVPIDSDIRPKACNFIKEQKVTKKTSSEECITVIFDAEDGKPIEFSSHESRLVTVTRNEISINHPYTGPNAEYTECLPQGIVNLQKAVDTQNCSILQTPGNETGGETLQENLGNEHAVLPTTCSTEPSIGFERHVLQNTTQQNLIKSVCSTSKASSPSYMQTGINQKQKLTKIPSRGKFSPQKTKVTTSEDSTTTPSHCSMNLEKSPLSPVKCLRFKKVQSPTQNPDSKVGLDISKAHPLQISKMLDRTDWPKSQLPDSASLPHHLLDSIDCGEPPTRDVCCGLSAVKTRSLSPPPPPGRSVSLLIKPNYEHSPPLPDKQRASSPSEAPKNVVKLSPWKEISKSVFQNITMHETQTNKFPVTANVELNHFHEKGEMVIHHKFISEQPPGMYQGTSKVFTKKTSSKTSNQSASCNNQELCNSKDFPSVCMSQDINPLSKDAGVPQKHKIPNSFPTSPDCDTAIAGEPFLPHSPLLFLSQDSEVGNMPDKGMKPRLPVKLKLLIKSPQLLRKCSTIPGKQEKDNMNAASKSCVNSGKQRQNETLPQSTIYAADTELRGAVNEIKEHFIHELSIDKASSVSPENCSLVNQRNGIENKLVKRSVSSSNKTCLKPALGMNGAKARSQSFSIHTGEKSAIPSTEVLGKVRTQIITNTSERGNSLTRQNSTMEGFQLKAVPGSAMISDLVSAATKVPEVPCSRQGSCGSMNNSNSQVGSPSKLPFQMSPKGDLFYSISKNDGSKSPSQRDVQSRSFHDEKGSEMSKHQPVSKKSVTQAEVALESSTSISSEQILPLQKNLDSIQCPHKHEVSKTVLQGTCLKAPEASEKVLTSSVLQPTIEEKVMLCIQENMQKGQGQSKSPTTETKQRSGGPSIASWFGFRKSKLPALNGRKTDISKVKIEKKEAKSSGFGSKQTKSEKRKDKKKTEQHCETENELNKKTLNCGILGNVPKGGKSAKATQNNLSQTRSEQKNSSVTTCGSGKDSFMKELLHRVDKKAAQQTESGSNNVSYRSVSKGSSQGSSLPSNSISTQGNQKKNSKTKADMEIPNETLAKVVTESLQEDGEGTIADSTCQSHLIESCCQMRTLDSGIGTFPLPDSGNRSAGRHVSRQELDTDTEVFTLLEQAFPQAPSEKAKTLEREVPSTANKNQESVENIITHSTSDPTMTAKGVRPFQSRLPKPASAGIMSPKKKCGQEKSSLTSASLEPSEKEKGDNSKKMFPDWNSKKAIKTKDRELRVCTYSASSSSDTETELEYETNEFGTGGEKLVDLMKNNKHAEQEENSVRKSFMGRPMSILDLYQHSLCGHYGEDGPEQLAHYSFIEQLNGTSTKDGKSKKIPSKLKQPEETKEDSEKRPSKISLECLNKFNSSSILLEKEKNSLNKVEGQEEENGKNEDVPLNSSNTHGTIDHLESLSDSLYDSFSSCASQGSNDV